MLQRGIRLESCLCRVAKPSLTRVLRSSEECWIPDIVAGIRVLAVREVLVQRLKQDEAGQLGKLSRRMAEAGVNIDVLYSDHNHQLILVVDDIEKGRAVSEAWMNERSS